MKIIDQQGDVLAKDDIMPRLDADGIVLLSETGLEDFMQHLASVLNIFPHPHAAAGGWTVISARDRPQSSRQIPLGMLGFTSSGLRPHTDRSFLPQPPPPLMCFLLSKESSTGGDVLLVDTAPILCRYTHAELSDLQNEMWLADTSGKIRQPLHSVANGLCINRYRRDSLGFPRVESRIGRKLLAELERAIASPARMMLRPGDGYLIHNHRILHGRSAFTGDRQGARLLAFIDDSSRIPGSTSDSGSAIKASQRTAYDRVGLMGLLAGVVAFVASTANIAARSPAVLGYG